MLSSNNCIILLIIALYFFIAGYYFLICKIISTVFVCEQFTIEFTINLSNYHKPFETVRNKNSKGGILIAAIQILMNPC